MKLVSKQILLVLKTNHIKYSTFITGKTYLLIIIVANNFFKELDEKLAVPTPAGLNPAWEKSFRLNQILVIKGNRRLNNHRNWYFNRLCYRNKQN